MHNPFRFGKKRSISRAPNFGPHRPRADRASRRIKHGRWFVPAPVIPAERDPAVLQPDFETLPQVRKRRSDLIRVLRNGDTEMLKLALYLGREKASSCNSAACPACIRELRRWFTSEALRLFTRKEAFTATIIPPRFRTKIGRLREVSMPTLKDTLRKQLDRSGLDELLIVGGIDFSCNEHETGAWQPHWQPHYQLLVTGCTPEEFVEALRRNYPADKITPRPIHTKQVTNLVGTITYCLKPFFSHRGSYVDDRGRANTSKQKLKPRQAREIACYVHRQWFADRLIFRNVRKRGSKLVRTDISPGSRGTVK